MSASSSIETWAWLASCCSSWDCSGEASLSSSPSSSSVPCCSWLFVFLGARLVLFVVVLVVGVVAQLVAIAQIVDDLARELGERGLVGKRVLQVVQRVAGLFLDEAAPQFHHVRGTAPASARPVARWRIR